jgi:RNA polymerase sigma factor (sigma-70 family)
MVIERKRLSSANLHEVLVPRIGTLRGYLDRHIPLSARQLLTVDDILQDVWVAAYRAAASFEPGGGDAVDRWLTTIAHSKLVDAVRRVRRMKRGGDRRYVRDVQRPATSFSSLFARLRSPDRTPSEDVHLVETAHVMLMALNRLSDRQRRAVELQFLYGLTRREIAEELETSEKAVKELVHRGLLLMRDVLGPATKYFTDACSAEELPAAEPAHAQA